MEEEKTSSRKSLKVETGLVTYNINGVFDLMFNPTDINFIEGLYDTFDALDKKQEEYKSEVEKAKKSGNARDVFTLARRLDAEMREMIDTALRAPVCDAVFENLNVYAMADGLPVWANLILAVLDETDETFNREQKRMNPRIEKYTKKYHK